MAPPKDYVVRKDVKIDHDSLDNARKHLQLSERAKADIEADRIWNSSVGKTGAVHADLVALGPDGYYREYPDGSRIYLRKDGNSGWTGSLVYGDIGKRYTELGGPQSWLGWPKTGEQAFDEGGRVSLFEHGSIYWWPDTGAIDLGNVVVNYTGLYCFGETDNDGTLTSSDEPYVLLGVVPANVQQKMETRSQIYTDVDAGDSREDQIKLFEGLPYGMVLGATVMEHDYGNPDQYRDAVKAGVAVASTALVAGAGAIPVAGIAIAPVVAAVLAGAGSAIVDEVNKLLDTADDYLGTEALVLTPKEMVTFARREPLNNKGIRWHKDSPLISGDGASYKVYVAVKAA